MWLWQLELDNCQPIILHALVHVRHRRFDFQTSIPPLFNHMMASTKPLAMLVARSCQTARLSSAVRPLASPSSSLAAFSTSTTRAYATPSGPPPPGFRLPKPERWDESKESSLDKAGKYFLLTEMARGMYVVLEQFFRPP
jgi:NADH dehydrogenase (ubiquinone) Fe-S protein 8